MFNFKSFGVSLIALLLTGAGLFSTLQAKAYAGAISPVINSQYLGVNNTQTDPASATIAASPTEQMELINTNYLIKDGSYSNSGTVSNLINTQNTFLSDPQVMWDPSTSRFYFSIFENKGSSTPNEGIAWGFSKTATPKSPSDFCTYFNGFNYGSTSFPDRESLGDTANFLLIGSNRYSTSSLDWIGSDLAWISKPGPGTTCPSQSTFSKGVQPMNNADGTWAYTPTPSKQVDSNNVGWVAALPSYISGTSITLFSVKKNPSNDTPIIGNPQSVPIPYYFNPPSAPQEGLTKSGSPAQNLETRVYFTQLIMAYDPKYGREDLWTAHTISGGAGSEVRWYEIDPMKLSLDQYGTLSDPNLYLFNGTISPDRVVNGTKKAYGDSAIINVSASSATTHTAIYAASVVAGQQSPLMLIKASTGVNDDYSCHQPTEDYCRWGDYSGATPDPSASTDGLFGQVYVSNEWNTPTTGTGDPTWQTEVSNLGF